MSKSIELIVLLSLFVFTAAATPSHELGALQVLWSSWKAVHSKIYTVAEEITRFAIFIQNYKKIVDYNRQNKDIKLSLNKFGDLTAEEFQVLHTGGYAYNLKTTKKKTLGSFTSQIDFNILNVPESIDWREKGAVTSVKNQQKCGSCWAFSTIGALESLYFINNGKLLSFSEQQIVDCDIQNDGCDGGLPETAFEYTAHAGLEVEEDYPYNAKVGVCNFEASKAIKVNSRSKSITPQSVGALKAALIVQPVSIAIQADQKVFQFYRSGVIKANCGDDLNHAVLVVGYTTIDGEEAFIIKNSWGTEWGIGGYVYISTDGKANYGNGVCGILGDPVVPLA